MTATVRGAASRPKRDTSECSVNSRGYIQRATSSRRMAFRTALVCRPSSSHAGVVTLSECIPKGEGKGQKAENKLVKEDNVDVNDYVNMQCNGPKVVSS